MSTVISSAGYMAPYPGTTGAPGIYGRSPHGHPAHPQLNTLPSPIIWTGASTVNISYCPVQTGNMIRPSVTVSFLLSDSITACLKKHVPGSEKRIRKTFPDAVVIYFPHSSDIIYI